MCKNPSALSAERKIPSTFALNRKFEVVVKVSFLQLEKIIDNIEIVRAILNLFCIIDLFKWVATNGLALGAVADFGAKNCQYTTKVDAR